MRILKSLAISLFLLTPLTASAATVAFWTGSSRTWNGDSNFSIIASTVTGAGNTIAPDMAITAPNLAGVTTFFVGEGNSAPTVGELATLSTWVNAGGKLVLLNDSGCSGCTASAAILTALGSSITVSGTSAVVSPFVASPFTQTPYNLVGQSLVTSTGSQVSGGTTVAGEFIHYQTIGAGMVIVFGDRSDHNFSNPTNATVNGQLFLDIIGASLLPPGAIPALSPAALALLGLLLAAGGAMALRNS